MSHICNLECSSSHILKSKKLNKVIYSKFTFNIYPPTINPTNLLLSVAMYSAFTLHMIMSLLQSRANPFIPG